MPSKKICGNRECQNLGKLVCSRCNSEFYCSKPCQIRAFPEHRFNCFELPSLRTLDENDDFLLSDPLKEMKSGLSEVSLSPFPVPESPKSPVIQKQASKVAVHEVIEKKREIPEIPKPIEKKPEVPSAIEKEEIQKSPGSVISNFRMSALQRKSSQPALIPTQVMVPKEPPRIVLDDLKTRLLPGSFVAVFLDGNPETKTFTVCDTKDFAYHNEIGQKIFDFLEKKNTKAPHKPKKNEVVLANYEGTFYRGVVKEKLDQGYFVHYIDYGNTAIVTEEDLRPLDKSLMFDVVSHCCLIKNFPQVMDENLAAMHETGIPLEKVQQTKDGGYEGQIVGY